MIIVNLDVMMAKRKISLGALAEKKNIFSRTCRKGRNNRSQSINFKDKQRKSN